MNPQQSLALDLVQATRLDRAAVTRLVADHAIAPARRVWSLPGPRPDESPAEVVAQPGHGRTRIEWFGPVPKLVISTELFDPVVAGFVLFSRLFPGALLSVATIDDQISAPEWIYFEHSRQLAVFRYADVERLVAGAFGDAVEALPNDDLESPYRVVENESALQQLAEAQALVRRVLDAPRPAEPPLLNRRQIGLRHVDEAAAASLDEILRADVHQRAVWLSRVDFLIPIAATVTDPSGAVRLVPPDDSDPIEEVIDDHGVYPTQVPETIRGVVALDLVRTFPRERTIGTCGHCGRPLVLTPHQVGRVDHGLEVFHPDCVAAHRRRWGRDYQRRRRAGEVRS